MDPPARGCSIFGVMSTIIHHSPSMIVDMTPYFAGARNEDKVSGMLTSAETESHKEEPIYISQDGKPASMRDNKLLPWGKKTTFVRGFKTFVGFGKAGK